MVRHLFLMADKSFELATQIDLATVREPVRIDHIRRGIDIERFATPLQKLGFELYRMEEQYWLVPEDFIFVDVAKEYIELVRHYGDKNDRLSLYALERHVSLDERTDAEVIERTNRGSVSISSTPVAFAVQCRLGAPVYTLSKFTIKMK